MNEIHYQALDLYNVDSWPKDVVDYLESVSDVFVIRSKISQHQSYSEIQSINQLYDLAIKGFRKTIEKYHILGYHCCKLTEYEIVNITSNGMTLPNKMVLQSRISSLLDENLINSEVANTLMHENQADDNNRKNILWFCFYKPYLTHYHGIIRFFKSWGGEALYNSHENNPQTSPILSKIGKSCIVEALIPIASIQEYYIELYMSDRYFQEKGLTDNTSNQAEWYITKDLPANYIIHIHQYPDKTFLALTQCDKWDTSLSNFN